MGEEEQKTYIERERERDCKKKRINKNASLYKSILNMQATTQLACNPFH